MTVFYRFPSPQQSFQDSVRAGSSSSPSSRVSFLTAASLTAISNGCSGPGHSLSLGCLLFSSRAWPLTTVVFFINWLDYRLPPSPLEHKRHEARNLLCLGHWRQSAWDRAWHTVSPQRNKLWVHRNFQMFFRWFLKDRSPPSHINELIFKMWILKPYWSLLHLIPHFPSRVLMFPYWNWCWTL